MQISSTRQIIWNSNDLHRGNWNHDSAEDCLPSLRRPKSHVCRYNFAISEYVPAIAQHLAHGTDLQLGQGEPLSKYRPRDKHQ